MDRRKVLHTLWLGVAGVGLSGCNTAGDEPTATSTATSTPTVTQTVDPASVPTASSLDEWHFDLVGTRTQQEDPTVSYRAENNTVIIEGAERAGSNDCRRVSLSNLDYWDRTLRVTITSAPTHDPKTDTGCDADIVFGYYRLAVTFSEGLPDRIIVNTSAENDSHTFERPE